MTGSPRVRRQVRAYTPPMSFNGWPAEAIEFYEGLEADNSKTYWTANKAVYEECVLAPMMALLGELEAEFGEAKVFRPYRDVRFSKDKSPYKTGMGATLASGGYIHLSATGLGLGNGMYMMAPDQLERYRQAVASDPSGAELLAVIANAAAKGITVSGHDDLKTAPKGYPKDHPRIDLLKHKGLVTWKEWPVTPWLGTAKVKKDVVKFLRDARPVNEWLSSYVGPTTMDLSRGR